MGEKLKNFLEDFIFSLKSYFSNPSKIEGKCKACGECCRTIVFYAEDKVISTLEQFENLKKWDKKYNSFEPSGHAPDGAMYFKCKALKEDGKCKVYFFRSLACRLYPKYNTFFFSKGQSIKPNCGYFLKNSKSFQDFMKK